MIRKMLILCAVAARCSRLREPSSRTSASEPALVAGRLGPRPRQHVFPLINTGDATGARRSSRSGTTPEPACSAILARCAQGDVVTVNIKINDQANFKNQNDRSRTANRKLGFDISAQWDKLSTAGKGAGTLNSATDTTADGEINRSETLELLRRGRRHRRPAERQSVISGSQEVRVNVELRVLSIAGIVRPRDIAADNTISYDKIAEARISYGGRGRITEVQQPGWGQQLLDLVLPF